MQECDLAYRALRELGIAKDILVWTRSEFEKRLHLKASLPSAILREGKVLHAAARIAARKSSMDSSSGQKLPSKSLGSRGKVSPCAATNSSAEGYPSRKYFWTSSSIASFIVLLVWCGGSDAPYPLRADRRARLVERPFRLRRRRPCRRSSGNAGRHTGMAGGTPAPRRVG